MASIIKMYRRIFPLTSNPNQESVLTTSQTMKEKAIAKLLSPFESYVVSVQSILIWENVYLSGLTLLLVNFLFWLAVAYSHRFYSIVATIAIFVFTYRTWVNQIWPEIRVTPNEDEMNEEEWTPVNPQVLSVPEISRYLSQFTSYVKKCYEYLLNMRQECPGQFCIVMTAALSALVVIGNCVSGVWLSYILVMSIMLGPALIIHVLPKAQELGNTHLNKLLQLELPILLPILRGDDKGNQNSELDEFLPETNAENLIELDKPMLESEIDIGEPHSMPSVHRIEELLNEEDDEIALPSDAMASEPSIECDLDEEIKEEDLSLKSEQSSGEIRFVPSHFDDSDSDDDLKEFTEGLRFTDSTDSSLLPQTTSSEEQNENFKAVISAIASTVPQITAASHNLMTTILSTEKPEPKKRKILTRFKTTDSDLTDFEIVSESELDPGLDE